MTRASTAAAPEDPVVAGTTYVRMPPGRRNVYIPLTDRHSAGSGVLLYSPTHRRGLIGQGAAYWLVRIAGARALPLRRTRWVPPMQPAAWAEMRRQWELVVGPVDAIATYQRPQTSRTGLGVLLLHGGRQLTFVKVRSGPQALETERTVLDGLAALPSRSVQLPRALAAGRVDEWSWLALSPLPARLRRAKPGMDVPGLVDRLLPLLEDAQDGAAAASHPSHWVRMHGDLTPWNVRRDRQGRTWIYDWEDAGWGPPSADDTYYRATSAVVFGTPAGVAEPEVVDFWLAKVALRSRADHDARFNDRLRTTLEGMRLGPSA